MHFDTIVFVCLFLTTAEYLLFYWGVIEYNIILLCGVHIIFYIFILLQNDRHNNSRYYLPPYIIATFFFWEELLRFTQQLSNMQHSNINYSHYFEHKIASLSKAFKNIYICFLLEPLLGWAITVFWLFSHYCYKLLAKNCFFFGLL